MTEQILVWRDSRGKLWESKSEAVLAEERYKLLDKANQLVVYFRRKGVDLPENLSTAVINYFSEIKNIVER